MPKLYELSEQYRKMMEMVDDALDNVDLEEDDLQLFIDTLESLEDSIAVKCENIVKFIKNLEGDVNTFKTEEKRLKTRRKYMENKIEGLKTYMFDMLTNSKIDNVNAGVFKIRIQKSVPSVMITNEELIPEQYKEPQPSKILKDDIKKALKNNVQIAGATLIEDKKHLRIV